MIRMLGALIADAIFIASVIIETLAALSFLHSRQLVPLSEEFEPVLGFYRTQVAPVLGFGAKFVSESAPQWLTDASILASVFFFLFFIAQARNAMAPYETASYQGFHETAAQKRLEAAIDWALPAAICAAGAFVSGPTLLPILTIPAAIFLAARSIAGHASWFEVSRSYYVNILCLLIALLGVLSLQR